MLCKANDSSTCNDACNLCAGHGFADHFVLDMGLNKTHVSCQQLRYFINMRSYLFVWPYNKQCCGLCEYIYICVYKSCVCWVVCLCVCVFVCSIVSSFVCSLGCLCLCSFVCLCVCVFVGLPVRLFICLRAWLFWPCLWLCLSCTHLVLFARRLDASKLGPPCVVWLLLFF